MSSIIIITVISLSLLAFLSSLILYLIAQRFKVEEDPRVDEVQSMLPAANCGGCGFAGCRNLAEKMVSSDTLDKLNCPVGGAETMKRIAAYLGKEAPVIDPVTAVLLCNGSLESRPLTTIYEGVADCRITAGLYIGESDCSYGCLGNGDCVRACKFGAISMNRTTGLPEIIDEKCTGCGACAKSCPRKLIELRKKEKKNRKIYVACSNCDKGAVAKRACKVACIACTRCVKVCSYDAIKIENNLAYIDVLKCALCRKCVQECPTGSIIETNFPVRKKTAENLTEIESV
jgi:Na+-translocating ferredoxin:NAD+ oxidoreductase subunit B